MGQRTKWSRHDPERSPDIAPLEAVYTLMRVRGFGSVKFRAIYQAGITPSSVLEQPDILPFKEPMNDKLRQGIRSLSSNERSKMYRQATDQVKRAQSTGASILTYGDPAYPEQVYVSNNPVPILYVRGNSELWNDKAAVAVVGSRNTREPYATAARTFASVAAHNRWLVVSGFAQGADTFGHTAALKADGQTVCVMPCGPLIGTRKYSSMVHRRSYQPSRPRPAQSKAATRVTAEDLSVHSFRTLLDDLASLPLNPVRQRDPADHRLTLVTQPTAVQKRVFELPGVKPDRGVLINMTR